MNKREYLELYGDVELYSLGTASVMADLQIKKGLENNTVTVSDIDGSAKIVCSKRNNKWFIHSGSFGNNEIFTWLMGAVTGDICGSIYEWHNIKEKLPENMLCTRYCHFTDDTVMTVAVAEGIVNALENMPENWYESEEFRKKVYSSVRKSMLKFGKMYPKAGYGGKFRQWLASPNPKPYNSYGNGSAMRVSSAGWVAKTLEEAEILAEISASVSHNHPDGISGAKAVAGAIFLLKKGGNKKDVEEYVSKFYDLDFSIDEIREDYSFDSSCRGSVPQAVRAFLEGENFTDVISTAISIGGDSDTIAAIAGSIAEVIYPIPQDLRGRVIEKLDENITDTIVKADDFIFSRFADLDK